MATSKKDYIAIAGIINGEQAAYPNKPSGIVRSETCGMIARKMADYFATCNPAFDHARFLVACGVAE